MSRRKTPKPLGGGWYLLPDGSKVQGRAAAYLAAGLDPTKHGNRRSDAARQRRRAAPIDERRVFVAALHNQRVPVREMARSLGVSVGTIVSDVKALRVDWKASALSDVSDWVVDELAVLENDEYQLRLRYRAQLDDSIRVRIYDRIARIMDRRADRIGLDVPTVRRAVLIGDDAGEFGGERVVFRAGGSKDEYVAALRAAQGMLPERTLRAVKGKK